MPRVAHRYFLVPAFLARHLLALEGIEARDRGIQVGQRQGDGRVAHVLVQVHRRRQRQADAREACTITY